MKPTLADLRKQKNWSQRQLAQTVGVFPSVVGGIEAHHVKAFPAWRRKLSAALGVDEDAIAW